jgi:hypothetical protein
MPPNPLEGEPPTRNVAELQKIRANSRNSMIKMDKYNAEGHIKSSLLIGYCISNIFKSPRARPPNPLEGEPPTRNVAMAQKIRVNSRNSMTKMD